MSAQPGHQTLDARLLGPGLFLLWLLVTIDTWTTTPLAGQMASWLFPVLIALQALRVRRVRLIFVAVAVTLMAMALLTRPDGDALIVSGFDRAGFIMAYFTALATLRHAADTSPGITRCGQFLAHQPPGRRYAALTLGAHLFAVILNYGSIALLGSLSTASAADEPDAEVRRHRIRRMLLAIQRGFAAMLSWSPLAFAVVISSILLPDLVWARALPYALVTSALVIGIGWAFDTIFKPRVPGRAPMKATREFGTWSSVLPLFLLLFVLMGLTVGLHLATGLRVTTIILLIVPALAVSWFAIQSTPGRRLPLSAGRAVALVRNDLPNYREELLLMGMGAFIGTVGADLLTPFVESSGLTLGRFPAWAALVALVWLIPLAGQLGMSPLLAVMLMFPVIPTPADLGVSPTVIFVAITGGWTLGAISSPFAAPTLLLARFGETPALRVSWGWNGSYTLICGFAISAWVVALTLIAPA
ncbi:MAG: hypothetical protein ACU0DK_13950 [Pseudooceanicola sp.]